PALLAGEDLAEAQGGHLPPAGYDRGPDARGVQGPGAGHQAGSRAPTGGAGRVGPPFPDELAPHETGAQHQAVMLNVLVNVLFGAAVSHDELRDKYLPAIENVIAYILADTVANPFRIPVLRLPSLTWGHARLKRDRRVFEELVDRVIRTREEGAGFWPL